MSFFDRMGRKAGNALTPGDSGGPSMNWGEAGKGFLAGGPLGALYAGLSKDPNQEYMDMYRSFMGGQAPQMGPAAQGQMSSFREDQRALVDMLGAQARGEGPSLATEAANAQAERGNRAAQSMAAGARGPSAGMSQFQALNTAGNVAAQAAQQAAMGRIQEQYNAQNLLGLTVHGARGADEQMSQFNANERNQRDQANLMAQLQKMGLDLSSIQALFGMSQAPSTGDALLSGAFQMAGMASGGMGGGAPGGKTA